MSGVLPSAQLIAALAGQGQQQQQPTFGGPPPGAMQNNIPLASMVDRLSPDAIAMQLQHAQLPWYAVPGMFRQQMPGMGQGAPVAPQQPAVNPQAYLQQNPFEPTVGSG